MSKRKEPAAFRFGENPFRPSFGVSPPVLAGRYEILEEVALGLAEGPGALERCSLFIGPRGTGKTVMLNEVRALAEDRGWVTLAESAVPGLVDRLTEEAFPRMLHALDPSGRSWRLSGLSGMGFGADFAPTDRYPFTPGLRSLWTIAAEVVDKATTGGGVLITIDEVHGGDRDELRLFGNTFQHLRSAELPVAIACAGLPSAVNDLLLHDKVLTFLRRSARYILSEVDPGEVRDAIEQPLLQAGRRIDPDALEVAVRATRGYPFMIQIIGSQLWRRADDDVIDVEAARRAVTASIPRMAQLVHEPVLADLSNVDRAFLAAMAVDDGPSRMRDIEARLGVDRNYANQYRRRLIAAEVIEPAGRGYVRFELPYLREYLRSGQAPVARGGEAIGRGTSTDDERDRPQLGPSGSAPEVE